MDQQAPSDQIAVQPSVEQQTVTEQLPASIHLASGWTRLFAATFDGLLVGVIYILFSTIFNTLLLWLIKDFGSVYLVGMIVPQVFVAIFSLWYYTYFTAKYGATIGKMMLGIAVEDKSTQQRLTLKRSFVRELSLTLIGVVPLIGLVLSIINGGMIIFSQTKQGIHDSLVNSVVIRHGPAWPLKKQLLFYILLIALIVLSIFMLSMRSTQLPF